MSGIKGNPANLRKLAAAVRGLPTALSQRVAAKVAPDLTARTQASFASGRSVYGDPRPLGVDGRQLTLERTGVTRAALRFVSVGTLVRARLGTRYARYLIGKYKVLPNSGARMPAEWSESTGRIARAEIARSMEASS